MASGTDLLPAAAGIGRVALRVGDLDRQVQFYERVIGLEHLRRDGSTAVLGAAGEPLFALHERPDLPERRRRETGLFHAAILVPSREALASALRRVESRWRLTGASDHLVSEALYLRDPEGNGLEIYRDRPRTDWPIESDGRVAMDTRPLDLDSLRDEAGAESRAPAETTIGHVHLEVSDLDETRRFYADGLGMRLRQTYGSRAVFLAAGDYHHHVGANVWNERTDPGTGRGLDWFEVRVPDGEILARARERLRAVAPSVGAGEPADLADGFSIDDPDGIDLRVTVDRP